jgi:hypothetical protein
MPLLFVEMAEIFRGILPGFPPPAKRHRAHLEGLQFMVYYFTPKKVLQWFGDDYDCLVIEGLSVFTPTAESKNFAKRYTRLYRTLSWLDDRLAFRSPWRGWGDFFMITMRYRPNGLLRLARNSLWLLIAQWRPGLMVIVTYLLARRLGVAGFGEYAFIATAILIGNALTTFGSDMYLIREIAAKSEFSELPSALALQLILSLVFIVFTYLIAPGLPNQTSESILALRVYSFALIPLAFFAIFTSGGMQKMIHIHG